MNKESQQEDSKASKIKEIAKFISFLFDGSVLCIPILLSVFFAEKGEIIKKLPSFSVFFIFLILIPYSFILYLYKRKKIHDLYMLKRKERIIPLIFINLSVITGFLILLFMQSTRLFSTIYMIYLIGLVVLSIITIYWKISFHTSYVTIFSIVFVTIYGKWALFTIILIPLMIWARVELKRHTWAQTISGVIITGLISIAVLYLKGFNIPIGNLLK